MTLYEINAALEAAYDAAVDPDTGEIINEAAAQALDNLSMAKDDKIENIALWIKNLNAEADAINAEKKKLAARQAAAENKAESLKRYLSGALAGEKFKTARVAISYRKSESVQIDEGAKLPLELMTTPKPVPNKTAIKEALKAGEVIEGVCLVTNNNIQIR